MTLELFINVSIILAVDAVILYVIYTLLGFLRMRKQKQSFASLHEQLQPGQNVMLNSGIYGKIKNIQNETVTLEVSDKTILKVSRFSIHSIIED